MTTRTREFTKDYLADIGVPPSSPEEIEYSDELLADEPVSTLKYTALRRCVFRADDGRAYAVEYEAALDMGDFELGDGPDDYGWHGDTVEAVEVEQRPVLVQRWTPVDDSATGADGEPRPFAELHDTGLLWLINRVVFEPRGRLLGLHADDDGDALGWSLLSTGGLRPACPAEADAVSRASAEATLAAATTVVEFDTPVEKA